MLVVHDDGGAGLLKKTTLFCRSTGWDNGIEQTREHRCPFGLFPFR
jgi:hypothetical protein